MVKNYLTKIEKIKYDRQIRLWGFNNQIKLQRSHILFWSLNGSNTEVLKNCILSGIGEICLIDDRIITQNNVDTHFYQQKSNIGKKVIDISISFFYHLNPNSEITMDKEKNIKGNLSILTKYNLIILANQTIKIQTKISTFCRLENVAYFYTRSIGTFGYSFSDCLIYKYSKFTSFLIKNKKKCNLKINLERYFNTEMEKNSINIIWPSFKSMMKRKYRLKKSYTKLTDKIFIICQALESTPFYEANKIREEINFLLNQRKMIFSKLFLKDITIKFIKRTWGLTICLTNSLLGAFVSNSLLGYLQKCNEYIPFQNILTFDLYNQGGVQTNMGGKIMINY